MDRVFRVAVAAIFVAPLAPTSVGAQNVEAGRDGNTVPSIKAASGVNFSVFATGLAGPRGLLFAPSGSMYVVEQTSGRIAEIAPDGRESTIASGLSDPRDLAIDAKEFL